MTDPAATMRRAADYLRDRTEAVFLARLADWLDSAALDAEAIGPNPYGERFAAAVLGEPDPYPRLAPPARPDREAAVTHVEGASVRDHPNGRL